MLFPPWRKSLPMFFRYLVALILWLEENWFHLFLLDISENKITIRPICFANNRKAIGDHWEPFLRRQRSPCPSTTRKDPPTDWASARVRFLYYSLSESHDCLSTLCAHHARCIVCTEPTRLRWRLMIYVDGGIAQRAAAPTSKQKTVRTRFLLELKLLLILKVLSSIVESKKEEKVFTTSYNVSFAYDHLSEFSDPLSGKELYIRLISAPGLLIILWFRPITLISHPWISRAASWNHRMRAHMTHRSDDITVRFCKKKP